MQSIKLTKICCNERKTICKKRCLAKKIVLRSRAVPLNVTLSNSTTFAARYERISRKNLPGNIRVTRTRNIGPQKGCTS